MKHLILISATAILASAVCACSETAFRPIPSPNPWADDYSAISAMENYAGWGTYNVHDPAICKVADTFYMYSTDAIFRENRKEAKEKNVPLGFIQMRKSTDLVNWDFVGWAFPEIPAEAVEWVRGHNNGKGAYNIWAPYMIEAGKDRYHLYYCVSAFGKNTSYIGLAEAQSPAGPWRHVGSVVSTDSTSVMNAIDPTVINTADGRRFMHYGSYFGGLFCIELNPESGFPLAEDDQGKLVARRANYKKDNLEAPEIIFNPDNGYYYLFGSYDPLMTTYNVRVGRSRSVDGPFIDFHGKEMADTTDNFPLLTAAYSFSDHPGWVGTAHCGAFKDAAGSWYMAHQGRLASEPAMMDLHVRRMFFTPDGWPVVSPERYAGVAQRSFSDRDLAGEWEIIRLHEPRADRRLEAGQIMWGEGNLLEGEWNRSEKITLCKDGRTEPGDGSWTFDSRNQTLTLCLGPDRIENIIVFAGHDWEREHDTALFTGLDADGRSIWGKRTK